FGIMDALQEEKYKIPGDESVLGCDNIIFSGMSHMSLTTIEHFVPLKGRDACDIIMRKIESFMNTYSDSESGSGKTTVIRAVLGALPGSGYISAGEIYFQGE
ncbi:substrate-binding domain-containing protein, partial [Blautia producta]|nr:substrate-binding domain-containing protein [Blautia producta]